MSTQNSAPELRLYRHGKDFIATLKPGDKFALVGWLSHDEKNKPGYTPFAIYALLTVTKLTATQLVAASEKNAEYRFNLDDGSCRTKHGVAGEITQGVLDKREREKRERDLRFWLTDIERTMRGIPEYSHQFPFDRIDAMKKAWDASSPVKDAPATPATAG